ncbi:MAG: peptidyl-prolyl cis-trans isomerase [Gemmatimonadota bacterium]|nr:peptidyl-prolyl cis-trans isomerase [Gemmatimonadota bacterium]
MALLAIWGTGCANQEEKALQLETDLSTTLDSTSQWKLELARVGDRSIAAGQLRAFYGKIPNYLQSDSEGLEKERNHLQTLIDMELLQLEAKEQGIDRLPVFISKIAQYRKEKLVGLYQIKKIKVRVSGQEVSDYFRERELARKVRFAQIITTSEDKAWSALREIASGRDFGAVAEQWSIHEPTMDQGGDTGRYVGKLDMPPYLRTPLFTLEEGEVSQPIDIGGHFALFKALESIETELDAEQFQNIYRQLFIERSVEARAALTDSLKEALNLKRDQRGLDDFSAAMHRGATSGDDEVRAIVLYRYAGGTITAGDVLDAASQLKYKTLDLRSKEAVVEYAEGTLVPDALFIEAALREGLDQEEEVTQWLAKKREQELVVQLRVQVLQERVSISAEDIRREYEENPNRYMKPDQIEIQEILVATEAEAKDLLERLRQGESMDDLARQYSKRSPELRDEEGRRRFTVAAAAVYGRLVAAARKAPVGELTGPLQVREGYSIFKVLSREQHRASFAEAKKRVRATVNWIKKQQVFEQFLAELRTKYASQVEVREDNLKRVLTSD